MKSSEEIIEVLRNKPYRIPVPKPMTKICIPDAKAKLQDMMAYLVRAKGGNMTWNPAYNEVADWLTNSRGKGLLIHGNIGLGKSLLVRQAIPYLIFYHHNLIFDVYDYFDINTNLDKLIHRRLIALDDIGREDVKSEYGTYRSAFAEIMDAAEKNNNLVIASTNLDQNALKDKYGVRTLDRIVSTMTRIPINGKSYR